jgi:spore coat polysaccharide biosynthesis predicted glycosyltransferase SpsG/RimJ/RimL family protein N-acetyltransferase
MNPVVLIADAGPAAGLGHLARTSALGAALREREVPIIAFGLGLSRPAERNGVSFALAPEDGYPRASAVVLDSYEAGAALRCSLRTIAPLVVFSDEGEPPREADLCVSSSHSTRRRCLSGVAFACLGPPYWKGSERRPRVEVGRVLVTTGGGDVCNAGENIAGGLRDALPRATVALVRGPLTRQSAPQGVELVSAPRALNAELERADLVVCSAGQTLLEALATGAPTVSVAVASNQRAQLDELERAGALVAAATAEEALASAISLAGDFDARRGLSRAARTAVDGRGAIRVADAVLALCRAPAAVPEIRVRPVTKADAAILLEWRNDRQTRRFSLTKHKITKDEHQAWLRARLADPDTLFWIVVWEKEAIGQIRVTRSGHEAEIHVALAPRHRGRRLACPAIEAGVSAGARAWPEVRRVVARIDPNNVASRQAFTAAGFTPAKSPDDLLLLETMIMR